MIYLDGIEKQIGKVADALDRMAAALEVQNGLHDLEIPSRMVAVQEGALELQKRMYEDRHSRAFEGQWPGPKEWT